MLQSKSLSQIMKDKKRTKGHALIPSKKTTIDGIKFDSAAEAAYYEEYMKPKAADGVDVRYHPVIEFFPGITWELDFVYVDDSGDRVYVDVKGMKISREAKIKIDIWKEVGPSALEIVKRDPSTGMFVHSEIFPKGAREVTLFVPKVLKPGIKI